MTSSLDTKHAPEEEAPIATGFSLGINSLLKAKQASRSPEIDEKTGLDSSQTTRFLDRMHDVVVEKI